MNNQLCSYCGGYHIANYSCPHERNELDEIAAFGRQYVNPVPFEVKEESAARRRANPPDAQKALFDGLCDATEEWIDLEYKVRGFFIDIAFPLRRLGIEVDGSQHHRQQVRDKRRTEVLTANWWKILRYSTDEVTADLDNIVQTVLLEANKREIE